MIEEDLEVAIKVVVVGNGAVGKSSVIQRFCKGSFTRDYKKTIGVDFLEKQMQVKGEDVRLMVWDTAGQEEFNAITKAYYRGAHVCIVAFSCIDRGSFSAVEKWKAKVEEEVEDVVMCVVENKIDLIEEAVVSPEEVGEMVKNLKLQLFRTSVKENFNVDQVFEYLVSKYLDRRRKERYAKNKVISVRDKREQIGSASCRSTSEVSTCSHIMDTQNEFNIQPSKPKARKKKALCTSL